VFIRFLDKAMFSEENYVKCVRSGCFVKSCVYSGLRGHLQTGNFIYRKAYCYTFCMLLFKTFEPAPDWPRLCTLIVDWLKAEWTREKCPGLEYHLNYRVG
jgi:hypothetical protein